MRKLFYAFLFAAAALVSGCTTDGLDDSEINFGEEDLSLGINYCEVHYRGDYYGNEKENYVVFFETRTVIDDEVETSRRIAFDIFADEVGEDNVPVGTFSITKGNMVAGENEGVMSGSYYLRDTESPFMMLIEEATLTITKEGEEYVLKASVGGNKNILPDEEEEGEGEEGEEEEEEESAEPETFVDVNCYFKGTPKMSGLDVSGKTFAITPAVYSVSYDEVAVSAKLKLAEWTFSAYDINSYMYNMFMWAYENGNQEMMEQFKNFQTPAYGSQFVIYTELPEGDEKVLPMGRFEIDGFNTGYLNTALGSAVYIVNDKLETIEDTAYSGSVSISPEGDGKYTINATMYGFNETYVINHSGNISFTDNTELEVTLDSYDAEKGSNGIYLDWQENINGNHWIFTGLDSRNGCIIELHIHPAEIPTKTDDIKKGLPSGTYTFGDKVEEGNAGYIQIGDVDEEGYVLGGSSVVYDAEGNIVSLLQKGTLTVSNSTASGSAAHSVVFDMEDSEDFRYFGTGYCESVSISFPSEYKLTQASATFVGDGGWFLDLADMTKGSYNSKTGKLTGMTLRTLLVGDEDITYAEGIPCEKFRFDTTGNPGTVMSGMYNPEDRRYYYSMVIASDESGIYELLVGGEVEVAASGSTNYSVKVEAYDEIGNIHRGAYEGRITTEDASEEEEDDTTTEGGNDEGGNDEGATENSAAAKAALRESAIEWTSFQKIENKTKFVGKCNISFPKPNIHVVVK